MSIYLLGNVVKAKLAAINHPLATQFHWHSTDAEETVADTTKEHYHEGNYFIINDKIFRGKDSTLQKIYYEIQWVGSNLNFHLLFGSTRVKQQLRPSFISYLANKGIKLAGINCKTEDTYSLARIVTNITQANQNQWQKFVDDFTQQIIDFYKTIQPNLIEFLKTQGYPDLKDYEIPNLPKITEPPTPPMKKLDLEGKKIYKMSHGTKLKAHHEQMLRDNVIIIHEKTGKNQPELFKNLKKGDIFYLCLGSDKALFIGKITDDFVENNYYEVKNFGDKAYLQRKYEVLHEVLDSKKDDKIIVKKDDGNFMTDRGFPSGNNTISALNPRNFDLANQKIFEPFFGVTVIDSLIENHKPIKNLPNVSLNRILYGAPGTGKTHNSIRLAVETIEGKTEEDIKTRFNELQENGQIEFVTFHQNYTYEDFILGIKPELAAGTNGLQFKRHEGIFYKLCKKAEENSENRYVIIIDEINRANISRVFGELITLLEPDKRIDASNELRVTLPNGGDDDKDFGVPSNLYLIGTMNTADKSIALVDIALRRRFDFVAYMPDIELVTNDTKKALLKYLNTKIFETKKTTDYLLGHSFFMDKTDIETVLKNKIIPLLMEYFSGKMDKVSDLFVGSEFRVWFDTKTYKWEVTLAMVDRP